MIRSRILISFQLPSTKMIEFLHQSLELSFMKLHIVNKLHNYESEIWKLF